MNDWLNAILNLITLVMLVYLLRTLLTVVRDVEADHETAAERDRLIAERVAQLEQGRRGDLPE